VTLQLSTVEQSNVIRPLFTSQTFFTTHPSRKARAVAPKWTERPRKSWQGGSSVTLLD
jgi:hypothetical protein